jgi:DNA polymerase III subunit alpha
LPREDQKTFDLLAAGETTGVFQLESAGMRRYIRELKPTCFSDIAAMVALYRPGPMDHIPTFIKSKHGLEPIRYPHPALEKILEETYGVIVYQDQVLFIVREFAGYSLGQADIFRKAMGKKIPEVMQKEKVNFINGAIKLGYTEEMANTIFSLIEPFAGYAFNKAHSVSYALIAYQTAYLKANYHSEYMTAFLNVNQDDLDKISTAVSECRRLHIKVLPPDVNNSFVSFSIEDDENAEFSPIRFGLSAIKNVGASAVEPLVTERKKNGKFKSIEDLCRRAAPQCTNRRVFESLIKAGALDCLGDRGALLDSIERILGMAQTEQKLKGSGQSTMFDLFGETAQVPLEKIELQNRDIPVKEKLAWEKELMGVYLSEHPFAKYVKNIDTQKVTIIGQINQELEGKAITVVGMVSSIRELFTKDHRPFCSAMIEDLDTSVEVMVWPKAYEKTNQIWQEGNIVSIDGKVKIKDERPQVICDGVEIFNINNAHKEDMISNNSYNNTGNINIKNVSPDISNVNQMDNGRRRQKNITINIKETHNKQEDEKLLNDMIDLLEEYRGDIRVHLRIENDERITELELDKTFIDYGPDLHKRLASLVGDKNIIINNS